MALKPELSFGASLAVCAMDIGIFQLNMPGLADVKSSAPHNQAVDSGRKASTWTAVTLNAALALLSHDPNIFIFGAGFAVVLDWYYRHANSVSPMTGQVVQAPAGGMQPGGVTGY
jgi:hypothetical protein